MQFDTLNRLGMAQCDRQTDGQTGRTGFSHSTVYNDPRWKRNKKSVYAGLHNVNCFVDFNC